MKLSEAIRLGAMMHPQCFGLTADYHYKWDKDRGSSTTLVATCALGGALEAIGELNMSSTYVSDIVTQVWPTITPAQALKIIAMNDVEKMSREAIADEVEKWEKELEHVDDRAHTKRVNREASRELRTPCGVLGA